MLNLQKSIRIRQGMIAQIFLLSDEVLTIGNNKKLIILCQYLGYFSKYKG
jgi:hypothetical protein